MVDARMVNGRRSDGQQSMLGWSTVDARQSTADARMLDSQRPTLGCLTVDARMLDGRRSDGQRSTLGWSMVDSRMVNGRRSDGQWSTLGPSTADARMVNGRRSDARWLTLGCSTTDGRTTTDDDRPTMTDARRVHHEANADDLALRCAPTVALVNFLFYFP